MDKKDEQLLAKAERNKRNDYLHPRAAIVKELLKNGSEVNLDAAIIGHLNEILEIVDNALETEAFQFADGIEMEEAHGQGVMNEVDKSHPARQPGYMYQDYLELFSRVANPFGDRYYGVPSMTAAQALLLGLELGRLARVINEKTLEPELAGSRDRLKRLDNKNNEAALAAIQRQEIFDMEWSQLRKQRPMASIAELKAALLELKKGTVGWSDRNIQRMYKAHCEKFKD